MNMRTGSVCIFMQIFLICSSNFIKETFSLFNLSFRIHLCITAFRCHSNTNKVIKWSISLHSHFPLPPLITAFETREVRCLGQYLFHCVKNRAAGSRFNKWHSAECDSSLYKNRNLITFIENRGSKLSFYFCCKAAGGVEATRGEWKEKKDEGAGEWRKRAPWLSVAPTAGKQAGTCEIG